MNLRFGEGVNHEKQSITTVMTICAYRYNRFLSEISHMASAYKTHVIIEVHPAAIPYSDWVTAQL
jgi:hypothetical protein